MISKSGILDVRRWTWIFGLTLGVALIAGLWLTNYSTKSLERLGWVRSKPLLPTSRVVRTALSFTLAASARIESSQQTAIECELERLGVSVKGNGYEAGGASIILDLKPEGSVVRKGDILCEFDSSDYVEMSRQQQILLERAQAEHDQSKLNLEIAKIAVIEYRDGLMFQTLKDLRGKIALSEADYERGSDRLRWSKNMLEKGYLPKGQITTEEFAMNRMALTLSQSKTALSLFEKYSAPKYLKVLESKVLTAEASHRFQLQKLQRTTERFEKLQSQIELCTVRAPHDGFLIYANDARKNIRIEPGVSVRQRQKLFYLPNLELMEAIAMIHESVVKDVKVGQPVNVTVEGLPGRTLRGKVTAISQLPARDEFSDIRYFAGTVKLETVPKGLKPGMSAEVEIGLVEHSDVLAIPSKALTIESGEGFCYVVHDAKLERRPIQVGQSTRDYLEVTSGLDEGEQVLTDPKTLEDAEIVAAAEPNENEPFTSESPREPTE